jgi:hypothetical protein
MLTYPETGAPRAWLLVARALRVARPGARSIRALAGSGFVALVAIGAVRAGRAWRHPAVVAARLDSSGRSTSQQRRIGEAAHSAGNLDHADGDSPSERIDPGRRRRIRL